MALYKFRIIVIIIIIINMAASCRQAIQDELIFVF